MKRILIIQMNNNYLVNNFPINLIREKNGQIVYIQLEINNNVDLVGLLEHLNLFRIVYVYHLMNK